MRERGRGVHATSAPCRGAESDRRHMVLQVMSPAIREIAPKRKRTVAKVPSMHAAVDATGKVSAVNKRIGKDRAKSLSTDYHEFALLRPGHRFARDFALAAGRWINDHRVLPIGIRIGERTSVRGR